MADKSRFLILLISLWFERRFVFMTQTPNTFLDPECPLGGIDSRAFVSAYHTVISAQRTVVRDTVRLLESRGWSRDCSVGAGSSTWSKVFPGETRTVPTIERALVVEFYLALAELDGVGYAVLDSVVEDG